MKWALASRQPSRSGVTTRRDRGPLGRTMRRVSVMVSSCHFPGLAVAINDACRTAGPRRDAVGHVADVADQVHRPIIPLPPAGHEKAVQGIEAEAADGTQNVEGSPHGGA